MTQAHILIIATSALRMTNGEPTGAWLEGLTTPFYRFQDSGAAVTVSSIAGGAIPIDARSVSAKGENDALVERYLTDDAAQSAFANTPAFTELDTAPFDAVFLPGGHGTMSDHPDNPALAHLIEKFDRSGQIISAVCHGPAALVSALASDGHPLVRGRKIAAFTDSEEHAVGLQDAVPFLLATKLRALGALHHSGPDFQPFAIRDGNLVTGQNPASASRTTALVIDAVQARATA
ncbi:MAG: type 1 glutamine amidotransferase domain-containing protein [Pseudomonadota bacterium]